MNAGHNAAWDQEWDLAIQAYGQAIQEFPEDPEAHIHLGLALLEDGRLDDSLKVYMRAHKLAPDDPIPLEKSADVLERMGRLKEAAQQYINVAEIYFSQRDFDKTIGNWERATRLTPGLVAIHAKLGQLRERIGDRRGAVREYLTLAFNFQRMGDSERALKAAQRALRLDNSNAQVLNTIQAIEAGSPIAAPLDDPRSAPARDGRSGMSAPAREGEAIGESDPLGPMGEAMTEALSMLASYVIEETSLDASGADALQAMEWQRQALYDEAIGAYLRAEASLRHPALKLNLGALLVLTNRAQEAIKHLGEATTHPKLNAGAFHALGYAYFKLNEHRRASRFLIQAVQTVDTSLALNQNESEELGSVYDRLLTSLEGRTEESLAAINARFLRMLEGKDWKQRIAETRRQIEDIMRDQGEQGALDILAAGRSDELTESVSRIDRYIRQGLLILAMDEAHRAVEYAPNYLPVHLRMAEIMMREGRVRNAITKYNIVAKAYLIRNENDRAASILSEVLEMAPLDIEVRENLIELLEAEGRWSEAVDQYIDLAGTYHQLGNFELARETFNAAERIAQRENTAVEQQVRIKHRIADIDQMRLDMRRAQRAYEEIIQLKPDDERAHRMLVDISFRQGNHIEGIRRLDQLLSIHARRKETPKILKALEELVSQYANEPGLRSRLAAIYQQTGRKDEAIKQLDALGELQLEAGLHKEAANTIRKIIALNPPGIDEYRRLLLQLGG
jgi:tetratricopeptide (TPR) repeat protein